MRRRSIGLCLVTLLLPLLAQAAAPEVALPDTRGTTRRVSEFIGQGQWTIVAVWSVDCLICRREIPEMAFFHDDHKKKGAMVLGVSVDGLRERIRVRKFVEDNDLGFENLIGERGDVAKFGAGGFRGTPTYLFFSPQGALVAHRVGSKGLADIERTLTQLRSHAGSPR